jgi:hypothetical protein
MGHTPGSGVVALSLPTSNKMQFSGGGHKGPRVIVGLWACGLVGLCHILGGARVSRLNCGHGFSRQCARTPQVHRSTGHNLVELYEDWFTYTDLPV